MPNLLVELGTEELPLASLDILYRELAQKAKQAFNQNRLSYDNVLVEATPRRVVLFVENLAARQKDQDLEISGPSQEKAYDPAGNPTKALEGFLKSKGATLKDVELKDTPKGKFVVIRKKEVGQSTSRVLPALLQDIFLSMSFPKLMRWESSGVRFPRPVRWLVVLLDAKVVSMKFAGIPSGAVSRGHRFLSPKPFKVTRADWPSYIKSLKKQHVVVLLSEREELIRKALQGRFQQIQLDEELIHMNAQLVEEPFFLQGVFSKSYLDLPAEVLASCMKKNQKVFACYDFKGKLMNRFVAVLNGKRNGLPRVQSDYENVLDSRLRDARYFYDADTKESFESKFPLLNQIVYLGKLGTMLDKTNRLEKLAPIFTNLVGETKYADDLKRVSKLSKIDLMTHLVYEFPDLQGVVGGEYASQSGEKDSVASAIRTQYLPKNLAEDVTSLKKQFTTLGALFGILDRFDLLVGAFGTGLQPTGSQDPFALRRAGGSVAKFIRAFRFHFSFSEMVRKNAGLFQTKLDLSEQELIKRMRDFFQDRVSFELQIKAGTREAEILAGIFKADCDDFADLYDRYDSLVEFSENHKEAFTKTVKVVERTSNILKGGQGKGEKINPELLKEPLEKELYRLCQEHGNSIVSCFDKRDYAKGTQLFGDVFYQPIHDFFDQVMVNVEDTAVRANRQALMQQINGLYTQKLADLSALSRLDEK